MAATAERARLRLGLAIVGGLLALSLVLGVLVVAPAVGLFVLPPTPRQYAAAALDSMEREGYFAGDPAWPAAKADALRVAAQAHTLAETYPALTRALAVAGGAGSRFLPPGADPGQAAGAPADPTATTADGITTLVLPNASSDPAVAQGWADAAARAVDDARPATSCGYVVDLRGTSTGPLWLLLAGVTPLVPDGVALAYADRAGARVDVTVLAGSVTANGAVQASVRGYPKPGRPIAVLTDAATGGPAESVAVALRGAGARTFGTPTAGVPGAMRPIRLYDDAWLLLITRAAVDRGGRTYAGPIPPDEAAGADAPQRAADWLRTACR